jgi:hypothetical protein
MSILEPCRRSGPSASGHVATSEPSPSGWRALRHGAHGGTGALPWWVARTVLRGMWRRHNPLLVGGALCATGHMATPEPSLVPGAGLELWGWSFKSCAQGYPVCRVSTDRKSLRFIFRRIVNERLMQQWFELKHIVEDMQYEEGDDYIDWQYSSSGEYLVQTLHAVINNKCVRQVYTTLVWKLLLHISFSFI